MAQFSGVNLRKNGEYWQAWWRDSSGRKHARGLGPIARTPKSAARRQCKDLERAMLLQPGRVDARHAPDLQSWCARYIALRTDYADGTRDLVDETVQYLVRFFGDARIDKITRDRVADWRAWLLSPENQRCADWPSEGQGLSDATACKHIRHARTIFGLRHGAMKFDLIPYNPFDRERGTVPPPEKDWPDLDDDDIRRLVDACPSAGWKSLIGLSGYAGLRLGESMRLTWADVQWERNRLIVRPPHGRTDTKHRRREVLIVPELSRLLLDAHEGATGIQVVDLPGSNLHRDVDPIIRRAGFEPWRKPFHSLRKARATVWRRSYPENVVDGWLGHGPEVARAHYVRIEERYYAPEFDESRKLVEQVMKLPEAARNRVVRFIGALCLRVALGTGTPPGSTIANGQ